MKVFQNLEDIDTQWENIGNQVLDVAEKAFGTKRGNNRERWISGGSWTVIDERNSVKR